MKATRFKHLDMAVGRLTDLSCFVGGVVVFAMMVHICADVLFRNAFNYILNGTQEIVTNYYMVAIVLLPVALVQRLGGHVMVEVFTSKLSPHVIRKLDVAALVLSGVAIFVFFTAAFDKAVQMTRSREIEIGSIDLLVWPARWVFAFGLLLLACEFLLSANRIDASANKQKE